MNEASWKRLIERIRENNVVPILGSRLLTAPDGTSLHAQVAARVLRGRGIDPDITPLPPFREINEAVSLLKQTVDLQDLYEDVNDAIRTITSAPDFVIPEAICQLATIADFRVLVTLTSDDLLARTLKQRCAVNEIVHSPNLASSDGKDLPREWQHQPGEAHVLYLFGKARSAPVFAIHDEDVLEYAHNVMARGSQVPSGFLGELQQRDLLLIGCNFPDWLSRFFLRATTRKRLSERTKRSWLIEPLLPEESLTCFLNSYSKDTEILSETSPSGFVRELHTRWLKQRDQQLQEADNSTESGISRGTMFFISYSRKTDQSRARKLYDALLEQGVAPVELWFDQHSLEPGQEFADRILEGVRQCRYFLPLVSEAANDREEGFVFREWKEANLRNDAVNREFIVPLIVDHEYEPERYTARQVKQWSKLDFGHAPDGVPDKRLQAKLRKLVREARRGG